jgi:HEPN domain-containing protein
MRPDPTEAGSSADWLRYARSDLALARITPSGDILLETLCFHAQRTVEKGIKAVLVQQNVPFPKTHNIGVLLGLLPETCHVPYEVALSSGLTDYAVAHRYPGEYEEISDADHREAIRLAGTVLAWAERITFHKPLGGVSPDERL